MELPDDNEKSYSSASTSPCPSPHTNNQNHLNPSGGKRLLPANNLYVVLYNFDARHRDELDLKWVFQPNELALFFQIGTHSIFYKKKMKNQELWLKRLR